MAESVAALDDFLDRLRDGEVASSSGQDSFVLGELLKALYRRRLAVWPRVQAPLTGVALGAVAEAVQDVQAKAREYNGPALTSGQPVSVKVRKTTGKAKGPDDAPIQQPTPESSPILEPAEDHHADEIDDILHPLVSKLGDLAGSVEGLKLESSMGYYLY